MTPATLPYKVATLLYCFEPAGRSPVTGAGAGAQPPGLWSPCGGKLHTEVGESPYTCACREAEEELGVRPFTRDLHLTGLVSEHGYQGQTHWLMFLFEVTRKLTSCRLPHREGRFQFFARAALEGVAACPNRPGTHLALVLAVPRRLLRRALPLPSDGTNEWTMEESRVEGHGSQRKTRISEGAKGLA